MTGQGEDAPRQFAALLREIDAAVRAGDIPRASQLAVKALPLGPEHPGLLNLAAYSAMGAEDFDRALALLTRAREIAPRDIDVLNSFGNLLRNMGRLQEAIATYDEVLAIAPGHVAAHLNRGIALENLGDFEGARSVYEHAIELDPNCATALGRLTRLAAMRGDYDTAQRYGFGALGSKEAKAAAAEEICVFASARADYAAARRFGALAVSLSSGQPSAVILLAAAELGDGAVAEARQHAEQVLVNSASSDLSRAKAHTIIGDIDDRLGNTAAAFAAYESSNRITREHYAPKWGKPENGTFLEQTEQAVTYFESALAKHWRAPKGAGRGPAEKHAFLVGFPRSGTTLLEQVLDGHPDIVTLEETSAMQKVSEKFIVSKAGLAQLAALDETALAPLREVYWRACLRAAPLMAGKVVIDKMPLNSRRLGPIAKLFPDAKIIFAIRDPRDVVWSCFKKHFGINLSMYEFTSLETTARVYDAIMRLCELYREKLDIAIFDIRYEDLVADFEGTVRTLCEFLEIDWHDEMRNFAARARYRSIQTPSASQVARGLYDGSEEWRRYKEHLAPVLPILAPWVERFGYA